MVQTLAAPVAVMSARDLTRASCQQAANYGRRRATRVPRYITKPGPCTNGSVARWKPRPRRWVRDADAARRCWCTDEQRQTLTLCLESGLLVTTRRCDFCATPVRSKYITAYISQGGMSCERSSRGSARALHNSDAAQVPHPSPPCVCADAGAVIASAMPRMYLAWQ